MWEHNAAVIEEFRANGGRVGGHLARVDLMLVTVAGARTGTPRTLPLAYFRDGDDVFVIASAAGSPMTPAWYYNMLANPKVIAEVGSGRYRATAVPVEDHSERERLFAIAIALQPPFADYKRKARRSIPIIRLVRDPRH
ncbi:hypothetical protein MSAS_17040 [Mycobacterium saskatchewanense]|uniref:nitroreductase/quinone reductase family protein n=1 Tax=Mycobacterium saskatchewanense TaxID=220927 RepID=UPI000A14CA0F|nr:nitroreductase/quinone reductase family protein [Mycobacterium saskatchewanense]BBX62530.1 hypothetical protein MSAS_17040 [Mycobacterium saskatchewanense]